MQFPYEHKKGLLGNHQLTHWCLIPYVQRKYNTITRDKKENEMIALDPFVLPQGYYIKPQTIVLVCPLITKSLYFGLFCFCYICVNGGFSSYRSDQLVAQYVQWHLFPISPELQKPLWTSSSVELRSSLLLCKQNTRKYEKKKGRGFPFVVWLFWLKMLILQAEDCFKT